MLILADVTRHPHSLLCKELPESLGRDVAVSDAPPSIHLSLVQELMVRTTLEVTLLEKPMGELVDSGVHEADGSDTNPKKLFWKFPEP